MGKSMKQFILADGDVLLERPRVIGHVMRGSGYYYFDIIYDGKATNRAYMSQWKSEVERERGRLINFDWS